MGTYASQGDIVPTWMAEADAAQVVSGDPSATTLADGALDAYVEAAEAEIDGYVGQRYRLPLSAVPRMLTMLACRVARYRILTSRPSSPSETAQKDYDSALEVLGKIADGTVSLGADVAGDAIAAAAPPGSTLQAGSFTPVYTRDRLGGF